MPKRTLEKLSLPARMAIATGAAAVFAIICCMIFAFIASMSNDPTAHLTLYGEICFLLSMLFCGFLGAKIATDQKFICGFGSGGILLLIVVAAALFLADSAIKALTIALLGLFLCAAGSAIGSREAKRKHRR